MLIFVMVFFSSLTALAADLGENTAIQNESAENDSEKAMTEAVGSYLTSEGQLYVGAAIEKISPLPDMMPIERKASTDVVGIIEDTHVRVIAIGDGETTSLILSFEMGRGAYGPQYTTALNIPVSM